jgi:hypothetical protein
MPGVRSAVAYGVINLSAENSAGILAVESFSGRVLICSGRRRGTLTARASDLVDGKVAFAWLPPEESETLPWAAKKRPALYPGFRSFARLCKGLG